MSRGINFKIGKKVLNKVNMTIERHKSNMKQYQTKLVS